MAVNKVMYGNQTVLDLTSVTAEESDVLQGYTFHKANGEQAVGAAGCEVQYPTIIIPGLSYRMVSWASGTDQQVADMLKLHYEGKINIYDYWAVGNKRNVSLSAVSGQPAQTVSMVLMHKGGKSLVTPVEGKTTCVFVVGQENALSTNMVLDTEVAYSWNACSRRTWCNSTYRNAFPEIIRGMFKQCKNYHAISSSQESNTNDYFAVPCEKEVTGTNEKSVAETHAFQFTWYANGNKAKNKAYWTRSYWSSGNYVYVTTSGTVDTHGCASAYGIAPFGVI